jgi:hypothetical protein
MPTDTHLKIAKQLLDLARENKDRIIITPCESGCWVEFSGSVDPPGYGRSIQEAMVSLLENTRTDL